MQYTLDAEGYISSVAFGSNLEDGIEYAGNTPSGYASLSEWAEGDCIQSYYIGSDGNLFLDYSRKNELTTRQKQQAVDYTPVLRRDIYETEETVANQYVRKTKQGKTITLSDIKSASPKLKITGIPLGHSKLNVYTQGKNMMPCTSMAGVVSGITFTKNASGSITALGTSTENIEYVIADGKEKPLFAIKKNTDYYLNLGGLQCELRFFDGETTAQKYVGASGLINLEEDIVVTQVIAKIPSGESLNVTFYPQLELGTRFTSYSLSKSQILEIDISGITMEEVFPDETLYADDNLYPAYIPIKIHQILVADGKITARTEEEEVVLGGGRLGLFSDYSTVYSSEDVMLEIEYSAKMMDVDSLEFLQGKATTTNRFKILTDGSIEAKNGYFSGRIEADSGYFKGRIEFENIYDENGKPIFDVVTQITRTTVTTAYVNALNVTAGSVKAENIVGDVLKGRTISGTTLSGNRIEGGSITIGSNFSVNSYGDLRADSLTSYSANISGGKIGYLNISNGAICYGKTSINDRLTGVYFGRDGISVGYQNPFKVTSSGDVYIESDVSASSSSTIQIGGSTGVYIDSSGVRIGLYNTKLESSQLKIGNMTLTGSSLSFSSNASISAGYTSVMSLSSSRVGISTSAMIGGSGYSTTVGFFGNTGTSKKTVSNLTSTTSASTVGSKLNDLLGVLRGYGLIG